MLAPAHLLALALGAGSPFPPPHGFTPTEKTRCDMGKVRSVDAVKPELKVDTPAGVVTYQVRAVKVVGKDGAPLAGLDALKPGDDVRVYYVVDNGAIASEVDLADYPAPGMGAPAAAPAAAPVAPPPPAKP
ncbi:MAG TPA: hypothetical protein VFE30_16250 [Anaeromyxobacteraceae bacterium]|jgi:hypothetical protein|nr:hypothetical protein [Anaeromyxobacteraceae bacterium]